MFRNVLLAGDMLDPSICFENETNPFAVLFPGSRAKLEMPGGVIGTKIAAAAARDEGRRSSAGGLARPAVLRPDFSLWCLYRGFAEIRPTRRLAGNKICSLQRLRRNGSLNGLESSQLAIFRMRQAEFRVQAR
jgi:hypothetical protein